MVDSIPRPKTDRTRSDSIEQAIGDLRSGRFVIVADNEARKNEASLCLAAQFADARSIAFILRNGSGIICVAMDPVRLALLDLPMMAPTNNSPFGTAFAISVDAATGVTTGVSAIDRANTIRKLADSASRRVDFAAPGHVYPLRAQDYGVIKRPGHTEGSVDLCKLAGLEPVAALCGLMSADGTMMRPTDFRRFARSHRIQLVTVDELIAYRLQTETVIEEVAETSLPTAYGSFRLHAYRNLVDGGDHAAMVLGVVFTDTDGPPVPVGIHRQCLQGDVLQSLLCTCRDDLDSAFRIVGRAGAGIVVYTRDDRSFEHCTPRTEVQTEGAGGRSVQQSALPAQILKTLGATKIILLNGTRSDIVDLQAHGIVVESGQIDGKACAARLKGSLGLNRRTQDVPMGGLPRRSELLAGIDSIPNRFAGAKRGASAS